ncbi:MAG: BMP family protein [Fimbriimonas sp.]|nr:BMP family protein [Fimbriimonas sp.]
MNVKHLLILCAAVFAVGCGSGNSRDEQANGSIKSVDAPKPGEEFKVALLTPGSVFDSGWNALAYDGLQEIQKQMNATVTYKESKESDIPDDMRSYARHGYNLVFGHGFEYNKPAMKVAKDFPDTVFMTSSGGETAKNVGAFRFELEQGFYLAGYLAGLQTRTGVIGSVAVQNYPSIVSTLKAFEAGAKASNPACKVLPPVYFGTEGDVTGAKQATERILAERADIVIHQANAAAQGVFDACKEKNVLAFGSNADQNSNPSGVILGSAVIIAKPAFLELAKQVKAKQFTGGIVKFGMDKGAIDFVLNPKLADRVPVDQQQKLKTVAADIKSGKIVVPEDKF